MEIKKDMIKLRYLIRLGAGLFALLLFQLIIPTTASLQSGNLRIREKNPVVNEGNQITLTAIDAGGQPVSGVTWESGSPDIAGVDSQSGMVRGVLQGFATV